MHRSVYLKHESGNSSKKVFLFFQGLTASPDYYDDFYKGVFEAGYDILSLRLSGHFESDLKALDKVGFEKWLVETEQVYSLLDEYNEIFLSGHSIGGLLAFNLANKTQDPRIQALALIAPALATSEETDFFLSLDYVLQLVGINYSESALPQPNGVDIRHISAAAGRQVQKLVREVFPSDKLSVRDDRICGRLDSYGQISIPLFLAKYSFSRYGFGFRCLQSGY